VFDITKKSEKGKN